MPAWQKVLDYMATQTADLVRYKSEPVSPFGWGSDLDCADDLTENMAELQKDDLLLVVQSCYRRLSTPRGLLEDDPDYGFDVVGLLHSGLTARDMSRVSGQVVAELTKDDRLETVEARATFDGSTLEIEIKGSTRIGDFSLTIGVTAAGAEILAQETWQ